MTRGADPEPEDPYGIAKYAVELDLRAAHEMFGLDYMIFRPHNVYGERQNIGDRYRNVIGIFMNQIDAGRADDDLRRRLAEARVHAHRRRRAADRALLDVPARRGEVFNIGADKPTTVRELAQLVAAAIGVEPDIRHLEARNEVMDAYASHEKARQRLRRTQTRLARGRRRGEWPIGQGTRAAADTVFGEIEVLRNLPPSWRNLLGSTTREPSRPARRDVRSRVRAQPSARLAARA